ncbi:AraC-like DNA-binding protein [Deinococcus metalli]|uniref:AraC-like DNA-binding protein n=1 Tax=Deinococcus metalli TaxID=1141878 RepID=A0A7W8KHU3_9DEIO|nr:helix-turn-helix domain-containing protein [Deinococcus metalli]MBB5378400.1 AraC-like DNA-binding protein [Deinococcus metalli]
MLPPSPALTGLVQVYWLLVEDHPRAEQHVFLPEHTAHLTFHAGRSWALGPGGVRTPLPRATLDGLVVTPAHVLSEGPVRALRAELYPWAARQLFGWSYPDGSLDLLSGAAGPDAVPAARGIMAALTAHDDDTAVGLLDSWLRRRLTAQGRPPGAGVQAAVQLYHSGGQRRVGDLADDLGLSARTLERQFAQEVGIGAKTLARLIRFESAHNALSHDPQTPLAALAYDLGFADQAHLTREFRALAGLTPGTYATLSARRPRDPDPSSQADPRVVLPALPGEGRL